MAPATPPSIERTITGEDWYGDDLGERRYEHVAFVDVDMTETTADGALVFDECTFRGVRFNVATYTGAAFVNCRFSNCVFFGATLIDCKLVGSHFERCTFDRWVARGGDWSFVGLAGADLRTAELADLRLREADLTAARCDGATLRNLDLANAALDKASFRRCDLRGSDLSALDPSTVTLDGAIIDYQQAVVIAAGFGLDVVVRTDPFHDLVFRCSVREHHSTKSWGVRAPR